MLTLSLLIKSGFGKFLLSSSGEPDAKKEKRKEKGLAYRDPGSATCKKVLLALSNGEVGRQELAHVTRLKVGTITNTTRFLMLRGDISKREVQNGRLRTAYFKLVA